MLLNGIPKCASPASHIVDWVNTHSKKPKPICRVGFGGCFDAEATRQLVFQPATLVSYPAGMVSFPANGEMPGYQLVRLDGKSVAIRTCPVKPTVIIKSVQIKQSPSERLACTFVFVTPRRWTKKREWIAEQKAKDEWVTDVFGSLMRTIWNNGSSNRHLSLSSLARRWGCLAQELKTVHRHWLSWSQQCVPAITSDALFMDRTEVQQNLGN